MFSAFIFSPNVIFLHSRAALSVEREKRLVKGKNNSQRTPSCCFPCSLYLLHVKAIAITTFALVSHKNRAPFTRQMIGSCVARPHRIVFFST